jgi:hypothetical protein
MANPEKHKRNLVSEFLGDGDGGDEAVRWRGVRLSLDREKTVKALPRRSRLLAGVGQARKPDPALTREPAPAPRIEERTSQAHSPEHLRKLQRLPKLRAPYASPGRRAG